MYFISSSFIQHTVAYFLFMSEFSTTELNYSIAMLLILGGAFLYRRYLDQNAIVSHPHYDKHHGWKYDQVLFDSDEKILEQLHKMEKHNGPDVEKPVLWIHVEREWNARLWSHFFERGSYDTNQPYLYLTIKSIVDKCGDHFNVAIIDDDSFGTILPNWKVDMHSLGDGDPIKTHMRQLGIAQLLHKYGGMTIPPSTICLKNLIHLHSTHLKESNTMYVAEFPNDSHYRFPVTSMDGHQRFKISTHIMGCRAKSQSMLHYIRYLELQHANDSSSESEFMDKMNAFCMQLYEHEKLQVIDGRMVGTRTKKNKVVSIHELMSDTYIPFELSQLQCIYVPYKEILSMPKYSWFAYLSVQDVQNSDTMIGKWLVKNE